MGTVLNINAGRRSRGVELSAAHKKSSAGPSVVSKKRRWRVFVGVEERELGENGGKQKIADTCTSELTRLQRPVEEPAFGRCSNSQLSLMLCDLPVRAVISLQARGRSANERLPNVQHRHPGHSRRVG